jgi:ATP-dependent Clp protease ATP-binding subunit ClpA
MARIPPKSVSKDDRVLRTSSAPEARVFGQDKAIEALSAAIKLRAPGCAIRKADRLYLFSGPTGVGKTEVARSWPRAGRRARPLRHVGIHGAAHGVAADRRAARLCRLRPGRPADRRRSTSIRIACCCSTRSRRRIPDLFNMLLQVMDHGKLTDHNGKRSISAT